MDCLFCKIIQGEIPADISFKDDRVLAFQDINPQAPHHYLIIPLKHIHSINELESTDNELIGHMTQTAKSLANELGIAEAGYRLVMNCNEGAGQSVFHIHMHLLGGRPFRWPPG